MDELIERRIRGVSAGGVLRIRRRRLQLESEGGVRRRREQRVQRPVEADIVGRDTPDGGRLQGDRRRPARPPHHTFHYTSLSRIKLDGSRRCRRRRIRLFFLTMLRCRVPRRFDHLQNRKNSKIFNTNFQVLQENHSRKTRLSEDEIITRFFFFLFHHYYYL